MKCIQILDTTLRDGEQAAGVAFSEFQKIKIAKELDNIGVDLIEVGIPAMGLNEKKVINKICELGFRKKLMAWSRMKILDIEDVLETGCERVHIAVPASKLHIYKKLRMTPQSVIDQMKRVVEYAIRKGLIVSIGAEDASRAERSFVIEMYKEAVKEGASHVRYADTVGIMDPFDVYQELLGIREVLQVPIDFHGHNDLGLATANALAAIRAGAQYVSCSVNGLGERAGNSALEEVVVALMLKNEYTTEVDVKQLYTLSKLIESYSGRKLYESKPVVGSKVFSHESGIHVDGLLKDRAIYEGLSPEDVARQMEIVLGKHSGKASVTYFRNSMS